MDQFRLWSDSLARLLLPTWPRLGSREPLSLSIRFVVEESPSLLTVLPASVPTKMVWYFNILGVGIFLFVNVVLYWQSLISRYWFLSAWSIGQLLMFVGVGQFVRWLYKREQARGPVLEIDRGKGWGSLPREKHDWAMEALHRLEIVSGGDSINPNKHDKPFRFPSPSVELQVIIDEAGKQTAWPLMKASGAKDHRIEEIAERIGGFAGIGVERINDDALAVLHLVDGK